jgi:hypothetical protein
VLLALGLTHPARRDGRHRRDVNASGVHLPKRFWNNKGGLEYPLRIATVFAGVALADRGRFSLDRTIGWMWGRGRGGRRTSGQPGHGRRASSFGSGTASRGDLHDGAAASPIA